MKRAARVIRGANFAYPFSERADYFSPRMVRLMIGVSALLVLALVALPFVLENLEREVLNERGIVNETANTLRLQAEAAAPILETKALLDSIRADLETRIGLRQQIADADYPTDLLLLHLSERVPDGIVLTNITLLPTAARTAGRPGAVTQDEELPEEVQNSYTLTIIGSAQDASTFTTFFDAVVQSPLFWEPRQTFRPVETTILFTITCRIPGTGIEITGESG